MPEDRSKFIPALHYQWLTGFYDGLMNRFMHETTFKQALVLQARVGRHQRVLDLGCGTATLTVLIKQACPDAEVVGLDGDPKALKIGLEKVAESGLAIRLNQGMAFDLPYPNGSFDRVFSSLLFHHLTRGDKLRTLQEVDRVLRPGGELHVADWGKAGNAFMRSSFFLVQLLDGFKTTSDNVKGLLLDLVSQAGLQDIRETRRYATVFGTLSLYKARKPAD